ncbi:hypothetical protein EON63_21995, partial [archaeon]
MLSLVVQVVFAIIPSALVYLVTREMAFQPLFPQYDAQTQAYIQIALPVVVFLFARVFYSLVFWFGDKTESKLPDGVGKIIGEFIKNLLSTITTTYTNTISHTQHHIDHVMHVNVSSFGASLFHHCIANIMLLSNHLKYHFIHMQIYPCFYIHIPNMKACTYTYSPPYLPIPNLQPTFSPSSPPGHPHPVHPA